MANMSVDLSMIPAMAPPPGITPNFIDPPTLSPHMIFTVTLAFVLTVPLVAIKLFTKLKVYGKFDYEDWVLVVAQVFVMAWIATFINQDYHGEHQWDIPLSRIQGWLLRSNVLELFYNPTILLAKWAIVLQIQRIFCPDTGNPFWWTIRATIWANVTADVTLTFLAIFQCVPRAKILDPSLPGSCINIDAYLTASGIYALLMNIWILVLPLFVLRRLQMSRRKRAIVCLVFGINALSAVASAFRLAYSVVAFQKGDATYNVYIVGLWATAELALTIVAASFPVVPLFCKWWRGKVKDKATVPDPNERRIEVQNTWSVERETDGWSRLGEAVEMSEASRLGSVMNATRALSGKGRKHNVSSA